MKNSFYKMVMLLVWLLQMTSISVMQGQSPGKMSYQAVIRTSSNEILTNQLVGMRISLLQGSVSGTAVYVETQTPTTTANGLVRIEIGAGTVVSGTFDMIDWSNGPFFIKTETDPTGATSYSISGTSELLSVPYALHSTTADQVLNDAVDDADADPTNEIELPTTGNVGDMAYWDGTAWVSIPSGTVGQVLTIGAGGQPAWSDAVEEASPIPNVTNASTGKTWMDRNLGAAQVATSSSDAAAYGYLYQWGRASDGHERRTSSTTSIMSASDTPGHGDFILTSSSPNDWRSPQNDNLWQGVIGTNNPCPSGYRLPTAAEWEAERTSWTSNNAAGAYNSQLRLPVAGYRDYSLGTLYKVGINGDYWSSTVDGTNSLTLIFSSSTAFMFSDYRAYGSSVRCLKDESTCNDSIQNQGETGVDCGGPCSPCNVTNSSTGETWMDRNLGATQVATSSTDTASFGDLYQWGRAADGHEKRTSATTSTLAGSDTPGHGDFITTSSSPYDWRSPQNDNLWQGVSGTNNPCPSGYRLPTAAEWNAERASWTSNNATGAYNSPLRLPMAGLRDSGTLSNVGSYGSYWSSTIDGAESGDFSFYSSNAGMNFNRRALGFSVRCLKD